MLQNSRMFDCPFFSFGRTHSTQQCLGQGWNSCQGSNLSHCGDNAGFLTRWATSKLQTVSLSENSLKVKTDGDSITTLEHRWKIRFFKMDLILCRLAQGFQNDIYAKKSSRQLDIRLGNSDRSQLYRCRIRYIWNAKVIFEIIGVEDNPEKNVREK